MSLPTNIPPSTVELGSANQAGFVTVNQPWYLFLYYLGIQAQKVNQNQLLLTQNSIAINQTLGAANTLQLYVATVPLTLTIGNSANLSTVWYNQINAYGGAVTVTPYATDKINGGTAGASVVVPHGNLAELYTDGAGNIFLTLGMVGPTGPTGATGATGAPGTNGNTVLYGSGAPASGLGVNGNFYIDTVANYLYGPKAGGAWPAGVSLVGPAGPAVGGYFTPQVWTSGADLSLGIGQSASITATNATSIPLHVACGDGQVYEMEIAGNYTAAAESIISHLQPNNTVPATNNFYLTEDQINNATPFYYSGGIVDGGFRLEGAGASVLAGKYIIFTSTLLKKLLAPSWLSQITGQVSTGAITSTWADTTTVWSSLGTIIMPNAWTGQIICTRIA